jgi:hypothetical protein
MTDTFIYCTSYLSDHSKKPDMADKMYYRLWKLRIHFETLNGSFGIFYSTSEYLAVDEVTVNFKEIVFFKVCILIVPP